MKKNTINPENIKTVKELAENCVLSSNLLEHRLSATVLEKLAFGNVEGLDAKRTAKYFDNLLSELADMQRCVEQLKEAVAQ